MKDHPTKDPMSLLKAARVEVYRQADLIRAEMNERGSRGQLWTNGQCAAWNAYSEAVDKLNALREEYHV